MMHVEEDETGLTKGMRRAHGEGLSKTVKRRKRDKQRIEQLQKGSPIKTKKTQFDKGKGKGKGKGRLKQVDNQGKELCYSWNNKKGSCAGDGACANGRVHKCQICLGDHRMVDHE